MIGFAKTGPNGTGAEIQFTDEVYMTHLNQVNVGAKNELSRSLNQTH